MSAILKSLVPFEALTEAEAQIFERELTREPFQAGREFSPGDSLVVVDEGSFGLALESTAGRRKLRTVEKGGLLGETSLFLANPVPLVALAEADASCLVWPIPRLKNVFRYSRTGAAKLMLVFTASLAETLRAANALLQAAPPAGAPGDGPGIRLDELELTRLQSFSVSRSYEAGAVIFEEGSSGSELFVITDGEVDILKRAEKGEGEPITLATLGPGEFFGEMAFVQKSPRSAGAVAKTALSARVLPSESLDRALTYNVGTALYLSNVICKILARRLNATLARIGS